MQNSGTLEFREMNGHSWFLEMEECFLSTILRRLIIDGCFFHDGDGDMWLPFRGQTPLEELHLHNCNLNIHALGKMLAIPRGLKRLCLDQTENTHHEMAPSDTKPSSMKQWVHDVLKLQRHSLEYLEIKGLFEPFKGRDNAIGGESGEEEVDDANEVVLADFEEFEKLETIRLWAESSGWYSRAVSVIFDVKYTCQRVGWVGRPEWKTVRSV